MVYLLKGYCSDIFQTFKLDTNDFSLSKLGFDCLYAVIKIYKGIDSVK